MAGLTGNSRKNTEAKHAVPTESGSSNTIRFVYVLVGFGALLLWVVVFGFSVLERSYTLERASEQLNMTAVTLADFNELTLAASAQGSQTASDARTEAMWRVLLQYPAASIWVESNGEVIGGMPAASLTDVILVREDRNDFTVLAALPRAEALNDWVRSLWQRTLILGITSCAFFVLAYFLVRALRLRTAAEQEALLVDERNRQLVRYKEELENTVRDRTADLSESNERLAKELHEREVAEQTLRAHDGLLNSVVSGAEELLGANKIDNAIVPVLELIGQTLAVSRVILNSVTSNKNGHLQSQVEHEWFPPGADSMLADPKFKSIDITAEFPDTKNLLIPGGVLDFSCRDIPPQFRLKYESAEMRSFLLVAVHASNHLWGNLTFVDSEAVGREWNWAEVDTLKALAGLMGAAISREGYLKQLSDANMIVQNSPTILYRLKGEPGFPLIYISRNISKFGHTVEELMNSTTWVKTLVVKDDQSQVLNSMSRMLTVDEEGASIEFRLRTGNNDYRWVENRYSPVRDDKGSLVEVEGIIIDITERKAAEEKIAAMARTDALTGLANRATFVERLNQAFAATKRGANPFAILYLDLDRFKNVNDTLGHPVGDELLKQVSEKLKQCTRESDLVARLGGDEFAVLQIDINEPANAGTLAQNIREVINKTYRIDGNDVHVTTSIGICPYTEESASPDSMLTQADLALYRAKEEGRDQYRFHSGELDQLVMERTELAEDLMQALEENQLELHYQPQVKMSDGTIVGMEALLRWRHPTRGFLSAMDFIPVAERTGSIIAVGHWVLNEACKQLKQWRDSGIELQQITLNLSGVQLKNAQALVDDISQTTKKWGLKPSDLELDVTEAMLAQTTWTQNDVLSQLKALGCSIAIDKFGMEYSSFDYLRSYSVNRLKIDQSFIDKASKDKEWGSAIRAITNMARELGIGVIAEGVETEEQRKFLLSIEDDPRAQGYYYSRAVDKDTAGILLEAGCVGKE